MGWTGPRGTEQVRVPDIVGLTISAARDLAGEMGLTLAAEDPDGPPLAALTWPGVWTVTTQRPAPGELLRRRGAVSVRVDPAADPGAGDRVPRRPLDPLDRLAAQRDPVDDT